jgi:HlyD family secretion protein
MNFEILHRYAFVLLPLLAFVGCAKEPSQVLGTLEYDRITLPAPAAERIVAVNVSEGQLVKAGEKLLTLERARSAAQTQAAEAALQQQRDTLAELQAGSRQEDVAQARANLSAADASAREAKAYLARVQALGQDGAISAADLDRAVAAAHSAEAQVRTARAALLELQNGARKERIAQAQSATNAAAATLAAQEITLDKLEVVAPRAGRIDSLPYKLGDQAPVGAPLAILLVGDRPYARVYVPEQLRARTNVGDHATALVEGRTESYDGRVRVIRSEPVFTPYYALSGKDAARLSYLAEIELDATAAKLPAGLPVRVRFNASK